MKLARNNSGGPLPPTMVGQHFHRYGIVGDSRAIADVIRRIELVAASRSTTHAVMILDVLAIGRASASLLPARTFPVLASNTTHALAETNGGPSSGSAAVFG